MDRLAYLHATKVTRLKVNPSAQTATSSQLSAYPRPWLHVMPASLLLMVLLATALQLLLRVPLASLSVIMAGKCLALLLAKMESISLLCAGSLN